MLVAAIDWTTVTVAGITAIPATVAALASLHVRREIRTPSGDTIGQVIERSHDIGCANHAILRKQNGGRDEPTQAAAEGGAHG